MSDKADSMLELAAAVGALGAEPGTGAPTDGGPGPRGEEDERRCLCCGQPLAAWPHGGRLVCRLDDDSVMRLVGEVCAVCARDHLDEPDE